MSPLLNSQVVKSAKDLIQRVARVMLEVDVLPGKNGFYVENNNKQVFQMIVPLRIQNSAQHFSIRFTFQFMPLTERRRKSRPT